MKRDALNLTEILIVLIIIGIIVIGQITILKDKINQYATPYYTTYNTLKKAAYNVLSDPYCPDPTLRDDGGNLICPNFAREFPRNAEQLCERLTEFINVPTGHNCNAIAISNNATPEEFNEDHVKFQTSNGIKYYISDLKSVNDVRGKRTEFFIVYADLNGGNAPNRFHCEQGNEILPDIVPFAVTRRGHVVPIGLPARSNVYMSATVRFPGEIDQDNVSVQINNKTKSLTFNEALLNAWPASEVVNGKFTTIYRLENTPDTLLYDRFGEAVDDEGNIGDPVFGAFEKAYQVDGCINANSWENDIRTIGNEEDPNDKNLLRGTDTDTGCQGGNYTCRVVVDAYQTSRW